MEKQYYTITPLTGVHIGTGVELGLLDYKIESEKYLKFSCDRILQRLLGDEKAISDFENASKEENMEELYKFFRNNCASEDSDYSCEKTDGFQSTGTVFQMYRSEGTSNPVIPGSSIKGSIRTALLNWYLKDVSGQNVFQEIHRKIKGDEKPGKYEKDMQTKLLSFEDAKNDPLRAVSLCDCSFETDDTQLVGELYLVPAKQTGKLVPKRLITQAEVLRGELLEGKAEAELCITINKKLQEMPFSLKKEDQPKPMKKITFDDIHKSCNDFYWGEFQDEYNKFYKELYDGSEKLIIDLKDKLEAAVKTEGQFIIRVGRWSQVEFVTFEENFRKPLTKKDKYGKPLGYGGTRTLFDYDGKYAPLGWCILTLKE